MAEFIISPGQTGTLNDTSPVAITITVAGKTGPLVIENLDSFDNPMTTELYSFMTMNNAGKRQFPTVTSGTISGNMIITKAGYEGITADVGNVAGSAANLGVFALMNAKTKIHWTYNMGATVYNGDGYFTAIGPKVSATATAWTTPITITVDGAEAKSA